MSLNTPTSILGTASLNKQRLACEKCVNILFRKHSVRGNNLGHKTQDSKEVDMCVYCMKDCKGEPRLGEAGMQVQLHPSLQE